MKTARDNNAIHFDSLGELQAYIDNTPRTWGGVDSAENSYASHSWDLGLGYQGAMDMAKTGWLEGAAVIRTKLKSFKPNDKTPQTIRSFAGNRPHVPAYCAGSPRAMLRKTDNADAASKPVLKLVIQTSAAGGTSAEYMSNFGAALARYIQEREQAGQRCEVIAVICSSLYESKVAFSWHVKRAAETLNLPALAYSLAHPACFRRLGFALLERCPQPAQSGYGSTFDISQNELAVRFPGAKFITGMQSANYNSQTPEMALDYLRAAIAE